MGTTYAIDFVPVDSHGRSAPWSWRALVGTEPPEDFVGFGMTVASPCDGVVVIAHDGEEDHEARRSQLALLAYSAGQAKRIAQGDAAIAGNHVVVALSPTGPFVLVAHLERGSIVVAPGDRVAAGQPIGRCGNSGNSTEPHVHVQVTDSTQWSRARGIPLAFESAGGPELPAESGLVFIANGRSGVMP